MLQFRDLRADEIDVRIAQVKEGKGMALLLYKDARCDMNILDETVGAYNWQRTHSRDNANCTVSIWDECKGQWISKEDVGTESNTEAQKGLASDSFKRACFNWGIGRELYTAPFIWVSSDKVTGKYDKFSVQSITIKDKKIIGLSILNETTGKVVFTMGKTATAAAQPKTAAKAAPKKAEPTPQPDNGLPFEIATETNRDKFRAYKNKHNIADNIVAKVITDCGLLPNSPDSEWEKGLMYLIAVNGGVQ